MEENRKLYTEQKMGMGIDFYQIMPITMDEGNSVYASNDIQSLSAGITWKES